MHDAQLMDVLHAGRDVLEAEQHTALRPASGLQQACQSCSLRE